MIVIKFGGTSVKDAAAVQHAAKIVRSYKVPVAVVLSATAGTTNALLQMVELASAGQMEQVSGIKKNIESNHMTMIRELGLDQDQTLKNEVARYFSTLEILLIGVYYIREATPRVRDAVAANGELLSTRIFAGYLTSLAVDCRWFDVREVMITDESFGGARPDKSQLDRLTGQKLEPVLDSSGVIITQGFIGSTGEGLTTTLGRGGSDYTAALLGNALHAERIEIWTDVSGVMTADPRLIRSAFSQRDLSFKEAAELAYFGANVLHPSTILPALEKNIPVLVKNTAVPEDPGTTITLESKRPGVIKAIAFRKNITVLTVESSRMLLAYGFLENIFKVFSRHKVSVDLISTSEITVSLTIDDNYSIDNIVKELSEFSSVKVTGKTSIISLVGENIKESPGFLHKVFESLDGIPIEMITFGTSNVNLSVVIPEHYLNDAVMKLHRNFFESGGKETNPI